MISLIRLIERFTDWDASGKTKAIVLLAPLFVILLVIASLGDNSGTSAVPARSQTAVPTRSQTDVFLDSLDRKCDESRGQIKNMVEAARGIISDEFSVNVSTLAFVRDADAAVPRGTGSDCSGIFAALIVLIGSG